MASCTGLRILPRTGLGFDILLLPCTLGVLVLPLGHVRFGVSLAWPIHAGGSSIGRALNLCVSRLRVRVPSLRFPAESSSIGERL